VVGGKPSPGKILLAMDGSENALRTVDYLSTMLEDSQSEVKLFHVVRGFNIYERSYENLLEPTQEKAWTEIGRTQMQSVFEEARTRFVKAGLDPGHVTTKVITGVRSRSDAIIKEASEGRYATIAVGRRGLSKVRDFFIGRVSMKVIQLARKHAVWVMS
jgi:nucleotide-binding universal stress UspA family protein